MGSIPVMEIFGPTLQGEGMVIGRKTMFVRTGGCDFKCVWCDSKFTWDGSQKAQQMDPEDIWSQLKDKGQNRFDYVTISGGNPGLIQGPMASLIRLLHENGIAVGLETQGSKWQDWFTQIDDLTLSPKPPSSGMQTDWGTFGDIVVQLQTAHCNFSFKVVVFDDTDFEYAKEVHRKWSDVPLFLSVGNEDVLDKGDISHRLIERLTWLCDKVLVDDVMNGVRVLPQLHALMWGNKRGV